MKYNDNGEYKEIVVKANDTLPVGTEVDFDGNEVPSGWTAVSDTTDYTKYISFSSGFTTDSISAYKVGNIVFITFGLNGTYTAGQNNIGTCTNKLIDNFTSAGRIATSNGNYPCSLLAIKNGQLRLFTTSSGTNFFATLILLVTD